MLPLQPAIRNRIPLKQTRTMNPFKSQLSMVKVLR